HSAKRSRSRAALLKFIRQPDKFLGTTLIGNNIANAILASLSTLIVARLGNFAFDPRYTSLFIGAIVLIFGEIVPKALFRDHADSIVPRLFPLLIFFFYLFRPFVALVSWINRALRRLLKMEDNYQYDYLTKDDISFLFAQANDDDVISAPQMEMIEDALDFKELEARNVMVPRTDIVAFPESSTIKEVIEIAKIEGFTRYPVYRNSIDDIIGILIIYDILKKEIKEDMLASEILHEPYFAPENIDLDVLLKEMQSNRRSMAIIVDSYGGTAGMVTMEDILEEIVGDIEDEYDDEDEKDVEQVSPNTWIAMADVEIDHLADDHNIILPEGDYETIAGLILDKLERIPHQGQFINIEPYRIQVLQATDKKIVKVKIHKSIDH
ncbi:MAG: hemolysin family protein, partial [Candidatus Cloacimonetes bacterium]|nr:hemolysin family protein [Candidatus Cloacimonadota bacterium]